MDLEMEPFRPEEENCRCRIAARFVMKVNLKPKGIKFLTPQSNGGLGRKRGTKSAGSVLHFPSSRCQKRMKGVRKKSYGGMEKSKNPSTVPGTEGFTLAGGWCEALKRGAFVPQKMVGEERGQEKEEGWKNLIHAASQRGSASSSWRPK